MPARTLIGYRQDFDQNGDLMDWQPVDVTVFSLPGTNTFTYQSTSDTTPTGRPIIDIDNDNFAFLIDGAELEYFGFDYFERIVGVDFDSNKTAYILVFEFDGFEFLVQVGGDTLPSFTGLDDFLDWVQDSGAQDFDDLSGTGFAPGNTIALPGTTSPGAIILGDNFDGNENEDDVFTGSNVEDALFGDGGDDRINGRDGDDWIEGGAGSDTLEGGDGNDYITPGPDGETLDEDGDLGDEDYVIGGRGDDKFNFERSKDAYVDVDYRGLSAGIEATLSASSEDPSRQGTFEVDKGVNGFDSSVDVGQVIDGDGGFGLTGTAFDDAFLLTDLNDGFILISPAEGDDTITIGGGRFSGRISLSWGESGLGNGARADLSKGVISNDGFGDRDTILSDPESPGYLRELRSTMGNDSIRGSANDESFILLAGTDTLNGAGGVDTVRYDRRGIEEVQIDLTKASGHATGVWSRFGLEDVSFSHTLRNVEVFRGTREGDDTMIGDGRDNEFQGRGGDDTLRGNDGNDGLIGGDGSDALFGDDGDDYLAGQQGADLLSGGAGDDTLFAGEGADTANGGNGYDRLRLFEADGPVSITYTSATSGRITRSDGPNIVFNSIERLEATDGNDTATAGAGNQRIEGGDGNDRISAGDGIDTLLGNEGNDTLNGGKGNDYLRPGPGIDQVDGGRGNDLLSYAFDGAINRGIVFTFTGANAGTADLQGIGFGTFTNIEMVEGSAYNDRFVGGAGAQVFAGREGNDFFNGGKGDTARDVVSYERDLAEDGASTGVVVRLFNGSGTDTFGDRDTYRNVEDVRGSVFDDNIAGNGAANILEGLSGDDTLSGRDGNDTLRGGDGADTLNGDNGRDRLEGGAGADKLSGGNGNDSLVGGDGNNTLAGGKGNDVLTGGKGRETLNGGDGADVISGGGNRDVIDGGIGNDSLSGAAGSDRINGGKGKDTLLGGDGNDSLTGGSANDSMRGGAGNDTLNGGLGNDQLFGDNGADVFVFAGTFGRDTVTGFGKGNDVLQFVGGNGEVRSLAAFKDASTQVGGNVLYDLDDDGINTITLKGVSLNEITRADLDFI